MYNKKSDPKGKMVSGSSVPAYVRQLSMEATFQSDEDKDTVNPTSLKSLQLGVFSMKPSTSIMKGTASFIRLEYQSTTTP